MLNNIFISANPFSRSLALRQRVCQKVFHTTPLPPPTKEGKRRMKCFPRADRTGKTFAVQASADGEAQK